MLGGDGRPRPLMRRSARTGRRPVRKPASSPSRIAKSPTASHRRRRPRPVSLPQHARVLQALDRPAGASRDATVSAAADARSTTGVCGRRAISASAAESARGRPRRARHRSCSAATSSRRLSATVGRAVGDVEKEREPLLVASGAEGREPGDVFVAARREHERDRREDERAVVGRAREAAAAQDRVDQRPPDAPVAVGERVDRLELDVRDAPPARAAAGRRARRIGRGRRPGGGPRPRAAARRPRPAGWMPCPPIQFWLGPKAPGDRRVGRARQQRPVDVEDRVGRALQQRPVDRRGPPGADGRRGQVEGAPQRVEVAEHRSRQRRRRPSRRPGERQSVVRTTSPSMRDDAIASVRSSGQRRARRAPRAGSGRAARRLPGRCRRPAPPGCAAPTGRSRRGRRPGSRSPPGSGTRRAPRGPRAIAGAHTSMRGRRWSSTSA